MSGKDATTGNGQNSHSSRSAYGDNGVDLETMELVGRAQQGDREALNTLFTRYYGLVHRIVHAQLGQQLRGRLESVDVVQQTFVAAVHGLGAFRKRDGVSLGRWLRSIAQHEINAAADHHGAMKRDQKREVAVRHVREAMDSGELVFEPEADAPRPVDELVSREDADAMRAAIAKLTTDYRKVIELNLQGMTWAQVATAMGAPSPDAARMLHARAVTELTRLMRSCRG